MFGGMNSIDFGCRAHRCLFKNECVQAHLVGLKNTCRFYEGRFEEKALVVVTFGEVAVSNSGTDCHLEAGQTMEVPAASVFRITTTTEADVMLLLRPKAAA
jgi:hypothetical protein